MRKLIKLAEMRTHFYQSEKRSLHSLRAAKLIKQPDWDSKRIQTSF